MRKQGKKKLATFFAAAAIALTVSFCPAAAMSAQAAMPPSDSTVVPLKDDIQWVYKVENGKIYRRLYNYSTANWIGEWIYVGEYPGNN